MALDQAFLVQTDENGLHGVVGQVRTERVVHLARSERAAHGPQRRQYLVLQLTTSSTASTFGAGRIHWHPPPVGYLMTLRQWGTGGFLLHHVGICCGRG